MFPADLKKPAAAGRRPAALGKRLKDVLEWLRTEREPRSAAEIRDGTGIDLEADAALLEALRSNPKVQATSDGLFQYQARRAAIFGILMCRRDACSVSHVIAENQAHVGTE